MLFETKWRELVVNRVMWLNDIILCNKKKIHNVKSHVKALRFYNFIRAFGWAYKRVGKSAYIPGEGGGEYRNDGVRRI